MTGKTQLNTLLPLLLVLALLLNSTILSVNSQSVGGSILSHGIIKYPSMFVYRGATVSIKHFFNGYKDYLPNAFEIIKELNINTLRIFSAGFTEFSIVHTDDWAENLDGFLKLCRNYGIRVIFHQLGGWVTSDPVFGIYPGEDISLSKSKIDKLAGNNSLGKNFLTDPTIPLWIVANEPDLEDTNLRYWCQEIAAYIKAKGANVSIGYPRVRYDASPETVVPLIKDDVTHLSVHWYFSYELQDALEADPNLNVYETVYSWLREAFDILISVKGDIPLEKIIIGESGLPRGYYTGWGTPGRYTNFTEEVRGECYHAVFQASLDAGIGGVFPFTLFDTNVPDGVEPWGAVGLDGTYYTKITNQYKAYY